MECIFVRDHVTYFSFSLSFPGFFHKNSNFRDFFSEILTIFSNSMCFPGLWPPPLNCFLAESQLRPVCICELLRKGVGN